MLNFEKQKIKPLMKPPVGIIESVSKPLERFFRGFLILGLTINAVIVLLVCLGILKPPKRFVPTRLSRVEQSNPGNQQGNASIVFRASSNTR